jgi:hypothetical protein
MDAIAPLLRISSLLTMSALEARSSVLCLAEGASSSAVLLIAQNKLSAIDGVAWSSLHSHALGDLVQRHHWNFWSSHSLFAVS